MSKRLFDFCGSLLGLIVLSPAFLITALLVKLDSPGPAFFRGARVGKDGRCFRIYKFRTMIVGAAQRGPGITTGSDPRVTRLGRVLRRTKIDELPQLINVVKGEMSLVGPRPEDPAFVERYTPNQRRLLSVRPGMTSRASLDYRNEESLLEGRAWEKNYLQMILPRKLQMELDYLPRRSLFTDLQVIAVTLWAILSAVGGHIKDSIFGPGLDRAVLMLHGVRNRHFLLLDLIAFCATPLVALWLRTDGAGASLLVLQGLALYALVAIVVRLAIFLPAGLYSHYWRFASVEEFPLIVASVTVATALTMFLCVGILQPFGYLYPALPRSIPILDGLLVLFVVGSLRYSIRIVEWTNRRMGQRTADGLRVVVFGAGNAGNSVAREMQSNPELGMVPVAFLDTDTRKQGTKIHGVPVAGDRRHLRKVARDFKAQQVIIAMPSAPGKTIRELTRLCREVGVPVKTIPGISEILNGKVTVSNLRAVDIGDLLRREPVVTDTSRLWHLLNGKRILITGAGGSIGSELCRQIAVQNPSELVLLGHGEHSIFQLANELSLTYPQLRTARVIADVRDSERLNMVFSRFRPEVVFHAAAHKHVPLMEDNLEDAITNNVAGSRNVVQAASATGVGRLVAISTDKAVNPTSVMGVTKRIAELLVTQEAHRIAGNYVCVRFGNVLGSRGSVVNVFREQIARGGPLTVTCPEIQRYFMTIPEAVQLVLQAAVLGDSGQVFVLDMGEPVKLVDLAQDLVELSGLQLDRDIDIVFTGIRPGEKLNEELFLASDRYSRTGHDKIFTSKNGIFHSPPGSAEGLDELVEQLLQAARGGETAYERELLRKIVPEYSGGVSYALAGSAVRPAGEQAGIVRCMAQANGSRGCGKRCAALIKPGREAPPDKHHVPAGVTGRRPQATLPAALMGEALGKTKV